MSSSLVARQPRGAALRGHSSPDGEAILSVIRRHTGAENAITGEEICAELGWNHHYSRVCKIVSSEAHEWPVVVCALAGSPSGGGGYFVASSYDEIEAYWAYLEDRRATAEKKVNDFENLCRKNGIKLRHSMLAA